MTRQMMAHHNNARNYGNRFKRNHRKFIIRMAWLILLLSIWSFYLRSQNLEEEFALSTTTSNLNHQHQHQHYHHTAIRSHGNSKRTRSKICFIQSVFYGDLSHPSMDRPHNVTSCKEQNQDWEFFYFTNLPQLITPGWTKVLMQDLPYTRHITMSRFPKFLGWQYPAIQSNCRLVMYLDGHFRPKPTKALKFRMIADRVTSSQYGLIQTTHPKGDDKAGNMKMNRLTDELERIVSGTKDTRSHVDASLKWFQAQPDWYDNATLYWNAVFGYDPTNVWFQNATLFFWDRYSKELDSWRDQPLWAYTLHHFGIEPLEMRHDTLHSYIVEDFDLKGDHHYDESTVSYVAKPELTLKKQ